ncbi:hypothetical protein E4U41_004698, partial [Claviceps citrina]
MAVASSADVEAVIRHDREDEHDEFRAKDGLYDDDTRVIDQAAERSLCFKFDLRLMPLLAIMYLFNALDKGNLSNAQTNGLSK